MAKVTFSKLGLKVNQEVKTLEWNGQNIEIKQYLPIADKFDFITQVLMHCQDTDNNNFMSISKMVMYFSIYTIIYYTNINITDKLKEEPAKLYDLIVSTGLMTQIRENIDETELLTLFNWCKETCEHLYQYRNSIYAILDAMNTDYENLNLDIEALEEQAKNVEGLDTVKQVLTKLG